MACLAPALVLAQSEPPKEIQWTQSLNWYTGEDTFNFTNYSPWRSVPVKLDLFGKAVDLGHADVSLSFGTNVTRNIPAISANGRWAYRQYFDKEAGSFGYVGLTGSLILSQDDTFSLDDVSGRLGLTLGVTLKF